MEYEEVIGAMDSLKQFDLTLAGNAYDVLSFTAKESMSEGFSADIEFVSLRQLKPDDFMRKEGSLKLFGRKKSRFFHGFVTSFQQMASGKGRYLLYNIKLQPWFFRQSLIKDVKIFQNKTTREIVEEVLTLNHLGSNLYEFRTHKTYTPRDYCVQYNETNTDFIKRLLAEEGIFYYFEMFEDKHMLIFGDMPVCHKPIIDKETISFAPESPYNLAYENVTKVNFTQQLVTGKYELRDYNLHKPSHIPTQSRTSEIDPKLEFYELSLAKTNPGII